MILGSIFGVNGVERGFVFGFLDEVNKYVFYEMFYLWIFDFLRCGLICIGVM